MGTQNLIKPGVVPLVEEPKVLIGKEGGPATQIQDLSAHLPKIVPSGLPEGYPQPKMQIC